MDPYYTDDTVDLYLGRMEDVLPGLPRADLILFSPPYNIGSTTGGGFGHWVDGQPHGGYDKWSKSFTPGSAFKSTPVKPGKWAGPSPNGGLVYDDHDDSMPMPEYEAWQRSVIQLCWAQLTDDGAIFYNHKPRPQRTLWHPRCLIPEGLPIRQEIIWNRGSGINFAPTHYVPCYEVIIVIAKDEWRLKSKGASGVGDVWSFPPEHGNEHPAPFPVGLPLRAIETTAPSLVIDPFCGSGTTLVAAKAAGVKAIGIDKTERYLEMAVKRLSQGSLFA